MHRTVEVQMGDVGYPHQLPGLTCFYLVHVPLMYGEPGTGNVIASQGGTQYRRGPNVFPGQDTMLDDRRH